MRKLIVLFLLVPLLSVHAQEPTGEKGRAQETEAVTEIRAELEAMRETDQSHRKEVIESEKQHGKNSIEVRAAWAKQSAIDAHNIQRLEEIIAQYGWPGSKKFGGKAASGAFLILQHSDLAYQNKYLPLVREAVSNGELPGSNLALLEDRIRLREGKKQIYGSQVARNSADEWEPLPLENEEKVDDLRASVGLEPISAYLKRFADRSGGIVSPKWIKGSAKEPDRESKPAQHAGTSAAGAITPRDSP